MSNASSPNAPCRKVVIIGDSACGKTSLLRSFKLGGVPTINAVEPLYSEDNYYYVRNPAAFENYVTVCRARGRILQLAIWDSGTQEQFERLRPLVYLDVHAIILCFSIDNIDSLENIQHRWVEEAFTTCAGTPIIIAGLKNDLRSNTGAIKGVGKKSSRLVTELEGQLVALQIGARAYIECSGITGEGVNDVFQEAALAALSRSKASVFSRCVVS